MKAEIKIQLLVFISLTAFSITLLSIIENDLKSVQDEDSLIQATNILLECGDDENCFAYNFATLSKSKTQDELLAITYDLVSEFEKKDFYCHDKAHHVGHFLYEYFDGDLVKALSYPNHGCGNALIHGAVENYLPGKLRSENITIENLDITSDCEELGSADISYVGIHCVHGIGHSLALVYDYDVIEAVTRCDEFQTFEEQTMCSDGLFMENAIIEYKFDMGTFDDEDIFYPCNKVVERYQEKCYVFQGSRILSLHNYFPTPAIADCEKLTSENVRWCTYGVINQMTAINFSQVEQTAKLCKSMKNLDYQEMCIELSIANITVYVNHELGDDFCNEFTHEQKEKCLEKWAEVKKVHFDI